MIIFAWFSGPYANDDKFESVEIGNSKLEISVKCQWGLELSPDETHLNTPICSEQKLMFYNGDSLIVEIHYPTGIITQKLANGDSVRMYENVIKEIGVLEGRNTALFFLGGYGGCNSCPEWNGLFSLTGELLWHNYGNGRMNVSQSGNLDVLLTETGIDPDVFSLSKFHKKHIF